MVNNETGAFNYQEHKNDYLKIIKDIENRIKNIENYSLGIKKEQLEYRMDWIKNRCLSQCKDV